MNFSLYDVLSNIIPGFIILFAFSLFQNINVNNSDITVLLVLSYVIGYFNNTLASWLEDFFYFTWGGKPSDQLLNGKSVWKVPFFESPKVKHYLAKESSNATPSTTELFQICMRYANKSVNERVKEFNSSYALSRNLLVAFIISGFIINLKYKFEPIVLFTSIFIVIVVWLRTKQRGFYFSREILNTYLGIKEETIEIE